jgi:D-alanyl-D-alanine carboxypeptidase
MNTLVEARPVFFRVRLIAVFLIAVVAAVLAAPAFAAAPFSSLAIDARNGKVLAGTDIDGMRHPASLTKMMTLYVLFQDLKAGRINLSTPLQVSRRASLMAPSKLGLKPGTTITVETAIKALVVKSANDAAATVAENLGGSEANFAARMTRTARSIGMKRSTFVNASGLPDNRQWTTARDMATLGLRLQRDFPQYYPYFRLTAFSYKGRTIRTHNRLLGRFAGTDGIKTGYIRASGFNLVTSAKRGGRRVVGVVLGGKSTGSRNSYMMAMLNSVFPKCSSGATIAAVAGSSAGAINPDANPVKKAKPMLASMGNVAAPAEVIAEEETQAGKPSALQTVTAEPESTPQEPRVLEAKIGEDAMTAEEESEDVAEETANAEMPPAQALPEKLPFEVKAPAKGGETIVFTSEDTAWTIQVGAFPEKEAADQRLVEIFEKNAEMLAGKPALTIEAPTSKGKVYRARFSGFTRNTAKDACKQLAKRKLDCMPMSPQS